jgi:hypothetical protein
VILIRSLEVITILIGSLELIGIGESPNIDWIFSGNLNYNRLGWHKNVHLALLDGFKLNLFHYSQITLLNQM